MQLSDKTQSFKPMQKVFPKEYVYRVIVIEFSSALLNMVYPMAACILDM
jgi:hypothetical protein